MEASIEENNGKKLSQLSLETYIEERLNLTIIDLKEIEFHYEEAFEIIATNGINEYLFLAKYHQSESFNPIQNVLVLQEIRGPEGIYKTQQYLYLQNKNTPNNTYLTSDLSDLINGVDQDQELKWIIDYLKDKLQLVEGYVYKEKKENDPSSFRIYINEDVIIGNGFGNTIQFQFEKKKYSIFHVVFRNRNKQELKTEVDRAVQFIKNFLNDKVVLNGHNISALYHFLKDEKLFPSISTSSLVDEKEIEELELVNKMVVGEYDSFHQLEIYISYLKKTNSFIVHTNYLFKTFELSCLTINDVITEIRNLLPLFRSVSIEE